jgi:hypothetical protein
MVFLALQIHLVSLEYVLMGSALNVQMHILEVIVITKVAYLTVNAHH